MKTVSRSKGCEKLGKDAKRQERYGHQLLLIYYHRIIDCMPLTGASDSTEVKELGEIPNTDDGRLRHAALEAPGTSNI